MSSEDATLSLLSPTMPDSHSDDCPVIKGVYFLLGGEGKHLLSPSSTLKPFLRLPILWLGVGAGEEKKTMEINDKVKVKGSSITGIVMNVYSKRDPVYSRLSHVVFVRVKHEDYEMEYTIDELQKV